MRFVLGFSILIFMLLSCQGLDRKRLDELEKENTELRKHIDYRDNGFVCPFPGSLVVPTQTKVVLGDTFFAEVIMSLPLVCDSISAFLISKKEGF